MGNAYLDRLLDDLSLIFGKFLLIEMGVRIDQHYRQLDYPGYCEEPQCG